MKSHAICSLICCKALAPPQASLSEPASAKCCWLCPHTGARKIYNRHKVSNVKYLQNIQARVPVPESNVSDSAGLHLGGNSKSSPKYTEPVNILILLTFKHLILKLGILFSLRGLISLCCLCCEQQLTTLVSPGHGNCWDLCCISVSVYQAVGPALSPHMVDMAN